MFFFPGWVELVLGVYLLRCKIMQSDFPLRGWWQTLVNAVLDELIQNMCEEPVESKGLKSGRIQVIRRGWSDSSLNTIGWEEIKPLIFRLKLDWIITVHRIEHVIRLHDYSIYAIKSQAFLRVLVWIIHGHLHWRHTGRYRFCWWKKSCTSSGCIKTANSEINYQMN